MHFLALEAHIQQYGADLRHKTDNLPAVAWTYKFCSSTSIIAACILQAFAVQLHHTHSALLNIQHISGIYNTIADVASQAHDPAPHAFLTFFTTTFPPSQSTYWTLYQFNCKTACKVFSELLQRPSTLASWR